MDYTERPDYGAVVDICTKDSLRELATPGLLAVLAPVAVGFGLGFGPLAAYLVGAIAAGTLMAVFLANSGGAWDNAKKMVEDGAYGGKGSESHAATVIGDTVGDPFKDTAGPAINPLIKVMNLVALIIAPGRRQPLHRRRRQQRRCGSRSPWSPSRSSWPRWSSPSAAGSVGARPRPPRRTPDTQPGRRPARRPAPILTPTARCSHELSRRTRLPTTAAVARAAGSCARRRTARRRGRRAWASSPRRVLAERCAVTVLAAGSPTDPGPPAPGPASTRGAGSSPHRASGAEPRLASADGRGRGP